MSAPPWPTGAWSSAAASACVPRPRLTVSEWADTYRRIAPGTSPETGPWRTERTPWLRGIMDVLSEQGIDTVVVMMASQMGKTEAEINILGYFVDQDPSPILIVHPTIEAMEAFSKERIDPNFRASPALRNKLETGKDDRGSSRKSSNTIRVKHFPGGYMAMAGANAPAGLASRPIRVVLCDEIDRFGESAGNEGDPIALAFQRTSNFEHNRKRVLVSTPKIDGTSSIQRWYDKGDQRQFQVPCPHCGALQVLRWERCCYKNAAGERDFEHVHYLCEAKGCGRPIEERHKPAMMAAGEWVAQQPGGSIASFGDLSALYSPWVKWRTLAEEWCKAQDDRNRRGLQEFVNLRLGQPWVEHQQVLAAGDLEKHLESYGPELPAGIAVLTCGVDVQDDRLELEIVGWGPGKESWGVEYQVLMGDPEGHAVWQLLDGHLARTWPTVDGRRLIVATTCVDSGDGGHTAKVYEFCRPREQRGVWAVKGGHGVGKSVVGKATRSNRLGCALFTLQVDDLKGTLFARLELRREGPGYCHFPRGQDRHYDESWFKGLLSERRVVVQRGGGPKRVEWKKIHDRNEPLDCRVYASAALEILNPNLERLAAVGGGPLPPGNPPQRGRRILSRGLG